jgi:hypothetical protein
MVQKLLCDRGVLVVIDVHAHSRKDGCFMYGCISDRASTPDATATGTTAATTSSSTTVGATTAAAGVGRGTISSRGDAAAAAAASATVTTAGATAATAAVVEPPRERVQWRYSQAHRNMAVRLFPRIMAKLCAPFRLDHCNNKMGAGRANTMRVVSTHTHLLLALLLLLYY